MVRIQNNQGLIALLLSECYNHEEILAKMDNEEITHETLVAHAVKDLLEDECYNFTEDEVEEVANNIDFLAVAKCQCCNTILMPDDECYEDDINHKNLCTWCSNLNADGYKRFISKRVFEKVTKYKFSEKMKAQKVNTILMNYNNYLYKNDLNISQYSFILYIQSQKKYSICDCCNEINFADRLISVFNNENSNVCEECINTFKGLTNG